MDEEFDWSELDDLSIIQETVRAVAVYENPKGDIVIRQEADERLSNADDFVVVPREKGEALIEAIQRVLAGADQE